MLDHLKRKELDLVQMKKKYGNYENSLKKFFSRFFIFLQKITNVKIDKGSSDFYFYL